MKSTVALIKLLIVILLCAIVLVAVSLFAAKSLLTAEHPVLDKFEKASLEDIRRIKKLAIQLNASASSKEPKNITLSDRDINLGISHFGPSMLELPNDSYIKINIVDGQGSAAATLPIDYVFTELNKELNLVDQPQFLALAISFLKDFLQGRWINLNWDIDVDSKAQAGEWISPGKLSVGAISLSDTLSSEAGEQLTSIIMQQPNSQSMREAWKNVRGIKTQNNHITIDYILPTQNGSALTSYQSLVLTPSEQQLIEIYEKALKTFPQEGPLVWVIAPLFKMASNRSLKSNDPVAENRAALLALAKYFGGDQLDSLLSGANNRQVRKVNNHYSIYRRKDLAQHWVLSAGITLIADQGLADLIGMDKEISDLINGKTISAWDLLADKAGARLAETATRSANSARHIQIKLSSANRDSNILPDLNKEFPHSTDRFSLNELDELNELIDLLLDQTSLFANSP